MIEVDFARYRYFPALRTRQAELKGLQELDDARKGRIVPILTLGRWPKATDFGRSAERARDAMGGLPFILDLTTDVAHLEERQRELRRAADGFEAWRSFAAQYPTAIPVAQVAPQMRVRDFTRQVQEVERTVGRVAFRIRDFTNETPAVIGALSAMDDPGNAIVFIDCQYIRNALAAYVTATIATINQLRTEFPELVISTLATSFPSSTLPFAPPPGTSGWIDILERELHARIGGYSVATYGDHGSVHSVVYDEAPIMRWAARVDYPRELDWYFERRPQDQTAAGYVSAAQAIVDTDPAIGTRAIWGEQMIVQAARGNPHGKAPSPWISVRVNIHLARQIDLAIGASTGTLDDDGNGDEEDIED